MSVTQSKAPLPSLNGLSALLTGDLVCYISPTSMTRLGAVAGFAFICSSTKDIKNDPRPFMLGAIKAHQGGQPRDRGNAEGPRAKAKR